MSRIIRSARLIALQDMYTAYTLEFEQEKQKPTMTMVMHNHYQAKLAELRMLMEREQAHINSAHRYRATHCRHCEEFIDFTVANKIQRCPNCGGQ